MIDCSEFTHRFFEEASFAWKQNKVRTGQAMYRYKKHAFPRATDEPPVPKLTSAQKRVFEKEIAKRHSLDEYAPPRTRRSPRLRISSP